MKAEEIKNLFESSYTSRGWIWTLRYKVADLRGNKK